MTDRFSTRASSLEGPASAGFAIVPDDGADLVAVTRALYVGTGGTLAVRLAGGDAITFHNLPDGALLPVRAVRVLETGTASQIVGLY
ncbi:spike base protein, RCAP_Rcc01079 family [Pelagibacterium lacus]|uniref:Uncharacterized protein n=1 Tax=Pelagibacterium lacus TaxID=2282655 RepID=A0A369W0B2_9HYPH|nr:hypothetical protein [Pelagibacterium lacus]RDE08094.1 hypothetical protein DVH29_13355 [Pelagibacterium lacus]